MGLFLSFSPFFFLSASWREFELMGSRCRIDLWGSSTKDCSGVVKKRRMDENNRKITVYSTVYNVVQRFDKFTAFEYRRWTTRKCRIIACKHFCRRHGSPIVWRMEGRLLWTNVSCKSSLHLNLFEKKKLKMILCKRYFILKIFRISNYIFKKKKLCHWSRIFFFFWF